MTLLALRLRLDANHRATLRANIVAEAVRLTGGVLGADRPSLARLRIHGMMTWKNHLVEFNRMRTESDIGLRTLTGETDSTHRIWTAIQQGYVITGQVDLARLAALLPNTLKIEKTTHVMSGRAELAFSGRPGRDGTTWKGHVQVSDLALTESGWPIPWRQPISVTLTAKDTVHGPVIENVDCGSSILSALLKLRNSGTASLLKSSLVLSVF